MTRTCHEETFGLLALDFASSTNQSLCVRVSESETARRAVVLHSV